MEKELVMYSRTVGCPFVSIAKRGLEQYNVPYREIFIDMDENARQRVLDWTGFLSVPTIVVADAGEDVPFTEQAPLAAGRSPRGVDRGAMITEAGSDQLTKWLRKHQFIKTEDVAV